METYPLGLAVLDFVPTLAFLIGAFFLVRISLICRGKACGRMVMAGSLLVFLGGFLKAGWKLLYTTGVADIRWMSEAQFVLSGIGFLGMCVAVIYMARGMKKMGSGGGAVMAMAAWKLPFLFVMTLASLGAAGILTYISFRRKALGAATGFIVCVLGLLGMGALASAEQSVGMQWVEEGINSLGQIGFMVGCILLEKNFRAGGCENLEEARG